MKMIILLLFHFISFSYSHLLFKLEPNSPQCYVDELFEESVMMIKWKIYTPSKLDVSPILMDRVIFAASEDDKEEVFQTVPNVAKGKGSFTAKKEGLYRICVIYRTHKSPLKETIYMNMRFGSDNMDEPKLNEALQSKDVSNLEGKANQVLELAKPIIERQKSDLEMENFNASETIKTTKWYKYLTFIQIGLCVAIGLVQVNNFRKYLKSLNII